MKLNLKVKGMKCNGCEKRIENALKNDSQIKNVKASHLTNRVKIEGEQIEIEKIKNLIEELGFKVEG